MSPPGLGMPENKDEQQPTFMRSSQFRTAYCNSFRPRIGDNDVGLIFSYQTATHTGEVVLQEEAEIVVTPREAKYISEMLKRVIEEIENVTGTIDLPPTMIEQLREVDETRTMHRAAKT
jgi:hypothetical protein